MKSSIHILGGGESGVWAAILAKKHGLEPIVFDQFSISAHSRELLDANRIHWIEFSGIDFPENADTLVVSPGVPLSNPLVEKHLRLGATVIGELEFAGRYNDKKTIAITGSNGKTTTTKLIYHLLKSNGFDAAIGGNYGHCLSHLLVENSDVDIYVLEVSSFQLDTIVQFRPDVAVLLNITADHLDRYEYSMDLYTQSKFRINMNQRVDDRFIVYSDNQAIQDYLQLHPASGNLHYISKECLAENGFVHRGNRFFNLKDSNLAGKHNYLNAAFAVEAVADWVDDGVLIQDALMSFVNDPHRMERVVERAGVLYINDSKATNVDSVYYALDAMDRPVIWIVGGQDKGNDYAVLDNLVRSKVKAIICLGADNHKLVTYFENLCDDIYSFDKMDNAVAQAAEIAENGDVVLLSPACASFDLFRNYMDRGDQFKKAVNLL